MTKDVIQGRIKEYYESVNSMVMERWVEEYAENGIVEDPVGGPVRHGHDQLRSLFDQLCKTFSRLYMREEFEIVIPPEATVKWKAQGETHNGPIVNFEGISVFKFAEDGKILQMRAFWDQKELVRQLKALVK